MARRRSKSRHNTSGTGSRIRRALAREIRDQLVAVRDARELVYRAKRRWERTTVADAQRALDEAEAGLASARRTFAITRARGRNPDFADLVDAAAAQPSPFAGGPCIALYSTATVSW